LKPRRALLSLLATAALAAPALAQQEPAYFEPPAPRPHFTFRWDALFRYDRIYHLRVRPDIERGRFELRPELGFLVSDRFRIGVGAVGDLGTDENEENARNFDNYRSRGATLERYFVEARPGRFTIRGGSFFMPFLSTEMLWDRDIPTPGASVSWEVPAGQTTLVLSAGGFLGPQREGDRTRIGIGQLLWRRGDPGRLALEAAAGYWSFDPRDLKEHYIRQNYSVLRDGRRELLSDYRIADVLVRVRFPVAGRPVLISLDGSHNFGTRGEAEGDESAFEGHLAVGRLGKPGDWRVFYTYQYIERDAVIGAYNTDDWWFHTWYRGHRVGVGVTVLPSVFVQGAVVFQRRLDLKTTLNRIIVDLVKMF
jgi:hypothetical protein